MDLTPNNIQHLSKRVVATNGEEEYGVEEESLIQYKKRRNFMMMSRGLGGEKATCSLSTMLLILVVVLAVATKTACASTDSSNVLGGGTKKGSKSLPSWLSIHKDKEKMGHYLELARKRHGEAVQKARDAYFHGSGSAGGSTDGSESGTTAAAFDLDTLVLDEYMVNAAGSIPDFETELERKLFVTQGSTPLFTAEECGDLIARAEEHFEKESSGTWTTLPSGQFDVAGFWIRDIAPVHEWFNKMVKERLFPLLVKKFPHFVSSIEELVVDNAYLFKYTPETGRRTDVHTDSGCLSFTIALNGNDEYDGGGTWFQGLEGKVDSDDCIIEMNVGQVTVRPGGVRHCGHAVTSGIRYIIGGFCMNVNKVEYVRMLLGLGSEESQKNNLDKAEEALEVAIALNPNFDGPYSHLADILTKKGNSDKAKQVLEHCFYNVNPESGEVAFSLGSKYLEDEEYDKTKVCMQACLDANECDVDAMMGMAQACAGQKDNAGEEAWYRKIISTPDVADIDAGKAYCNLGVLHEGTEEEIECYKKSLELSPGRFPPAFSLGCAYASRKDWSSAVVAFRQAIEYAEDRSDDEKQAIENLYLSTTYKLQQESPSGPQSREEMMKKFLDIMGEENYKKMAAMRGQ